MQTYTGLLARNRGRVIKSWMKEAEFRRYLFLDSGASCFLRMNARPRILLNHELGPCEFRKTAAFRHQFIESSAFDHMSAVEHKDARGVANGREPVSDHESRASLHHFIESGVNLGFGDGVERTGRLIEDQDWWIFQERARDRQPLPLAAGQHAPALAGIGLESPLAALDEFQRLGAGRRDPQFLIGGVRFADAQIVRDRTIEQ